MATIQGGRSAGRITNSISCCGQASREATVFLEGSISLASLGNFRFGGEHFFGVPSRRRRPSVGINSPDHSGDFATGLTFFSQISNAVWPQIPSPWASGVAALLYQLQKTQWLSQRDLAAQQWQQASCLVRHAIDTSSFYRELYDRHGVVLTNIKNLDDWSQLPIVDRRALQSAGATWRSATPPQDHGALFEHVTSGSSGRPLHSISTTLTHLIKSSLILRQHLWAGRNFSKKAAFIVEKPKDIKVPAQPSDNWENATKNVVLTGSALSISLHMDAAQQIEELLAFQPDYLISYPSVIENLARHCISRSIALPSLLQIGTFGEILSSKCRKLVFDAWGLKVFDVYSAMEAGPIALQCPVHEHYHEQSEAVIVEILDAGDRPCQVGETGRVVITSLHNFAAPLIRYEIGDLATRGAPCPCGRSLPVIQRVMGRQRNMLRYPDGSARWPSLSEAGLAMVFSKAGEMPAIEQFQIVQHSTHRIEARLVTKRRYTGSEEALLVQYLHHEFGGHWQIDFSYPAEISRGPGGKFEDFLSYVSPEPLTGESIA